jgi:hypothetical protein
VLSLPDKLVWISFLRNEARQDYTATKAQKHLVALMDTVHDDPESDGWCGCPGHSHVISQIMQIIWHDPPPL